MQEYDGNDEILRQALAVDLDGVFEAFMIRYQHEIYRYIYAHIQHTEQTKDLLQELFLRTYKALRNMSPSDRQAIQLRAWLFASARNLIHDDSQERRRAQIVSIESLPEEKRDFVDETGEQPEAALEQAERHEQLQQLLKLLPEDYRTVVVMRYLAEQRYAEIAETVGQPKKAVEAIIENAMRRLRRAAASQQVF